MSDNGNPFDYYVRSGFGDEVRELARQAGDVVALQELEGQLVQHHRPTLDAVEGVVEQTIDRAPTEAVGQFGNVVQAATFARGALELYALSVDKANHTSPSPRSVEKLRQAYEEQRHSHWGAVEPVRADYEEGGPRVGRNYEADLDAYEDDRHARKEAAMAGLSQEYWQLMANLDTDAGIVKSTFEQGPNPGILRGLVVYGVLPLEALASWPGVHLTLDEWKAYLIQRLTPADVLAPTANGLPLFTDIPPEYREALLNDLDVMAAVAAGLDVDAAQGRSDAGVLLSEGSVDGDQEQPLWDTYQRLAWIGAYAGYAQSHLWNYAGVQLSPRMRSYLDAFYTTAADAGIERAEERSGSLTFETDYASVSRDNLRELNTILDNVELITGDSEHDPSFKQVFADGLLALSDERIGGSFDLLPGTIQSATIGDHEYRDRVHDAEELFELSRLLDDSTVTPGVEFSKHTTITLMQASPSFSGSILGSEYSTEEEVAAAHDNWNQITSLFEVTSRNHQAMHDLITGENMDGFQDAQWSWDGDEFRIGEFDSRQFLRNLYTTPWIDNGEHASQVVNWISQQHSANGLDVELSDDAFLHWVDAMTSTGEGGIYHYLMNVNDLGEHVYSDGEVPDGNSTFGGVNPELAKSVATLTNAYIDWIADYSEDPGSGENAAESAASDGVMDTGEKIRLLTLGVTTDDSAALLASRIVGYQLDNMATIESDGSADSAAQNARLQAYFDTALNNEAMSRTADEVEAEHEAAERRNQYLRVAASVIRSFNPIDYDVPGLHMRAISEQLWNASRYGTVSYLVEQAYSDPTTVAMLEPNADLMNNDPSDFKYRSTYDILSTQVLNGSIDPATLPSNLVQGSPPRLRPIEEIVVQQPDQHGPEAPPSMDTVRTSMQSAIYAATGIDAEAFNLELWDTYGTIRERYSMDADSIEDFNTDGGARNF